MNERGFFTLMGLCFLIVVAVMARGVQESEGNYYSVTDDFVQAAELQNIADSALIEAVDLIKKNREEIAAGLDVVELVPKPPKIYNVPRYRKQHPIPLNKSYEADVEVYAEYGIDVMNGDIGNIWLKRKVYPERDIVDRYLENNQREGVIIISVASRESDKTGGKIYRRAIAYFFTDDAKDKNIYFMNSLVEEK